VAKAGDRSSKVSDPVAKVSAGKSQFSQQFSVGLSGLDAGIIFALHNSMTLHSGECCGGTPESRGVQKETK
jgi:hypothetical protein